MANWWDKYESEPAEKPDHAWWRKYEEEEKPKPYSRRGSVEARNKQAEPDILSKRAQRFQLGNELDAELPAFMGRGDDMLAHPERVKAAAAQVRPDLPAGVDAASYERFMDAESGGMGIVPGTGRSMEDAVVVGQNLGVIGAKFREGWRTTKAGAAADEYLRTGRITVGTTPGVGDVDYPVYLEGAAAEKYVRDLASTTNDTALVEAFDKQVGAGARALTSTLAQPEQLLSIPGGIVGAMVGQPTLGAALGAAPSTVKGYYSDLLANLQAGAPHDIASANALAGAGIDFATETLGGRFGASEGVLGAGARSAAEEASAELGRMGSDYAFSLADESFASKLPKTFGEGAERVGEAGIAGGLGAAIMVGAPRLPGKLGEGLAAAREMLARAGGVSDGRPDAKDTRSSIKIDPKINAGLPTASVQLTTADAGTIIDTRLSSLREASQRNRLDDGTVKTLQREDEELRLTLQEDESRKQQGIPQTPERPYLSDNARNLISQKRAEIREKLEQHRAAVGYGNELRDLETRLNKLGESDTEFVALADSLVRGQGAGVTRAAQQMAATTPQKQSQTLPATPVTQAPRTMSFDEAMSKAEEDAASRISSDPTYARWVKKNPSAHGTQLRAQARAILASQNQPQALPATPVAPPVSEAPVASQEAATSVPASTPEVTPAPVVQTPVTSAQVPSVSNTPKTISEGDALAQAFTELQTRSLNDPEFQKQVIANPSLMRQMATQRAAEIVAQSSAPKAPEAAATDAADVPTATAPSSRLASVQNARAAMLVVGNAEVPASSEMRRVANELKTSPNVQDTKVVVVSAEDAATPGNPLHKQMEDGTNASKPGVYNANDDTIYIRDDVPAEVAVHETTHAATVKAIAAVEQGVVSDPDATLALDNLKAATTRLGELTEADLPGVSPDILARIKYAGKNVQETVAILRSSPETAQALRDANITVDVKVDRKTKQPVKMNWFKAVVNNIADLLFRAKVFKQQHRDAVVRVVEKMLLADVAIDSSKKLERTDVRAIKMTDVLEGNAAARQVGTGANKPVPKMDEMFVGEQGAGQESRNNTIKPDTGGVELPQGTIEQRIGERIQSWSAPVISPKGTGSTSAKLMGEKAIGISNEQRLAAEVLAVDLKKQMAKELAKGMKKLPEHARARYAFRVGQALAGDATILDELPKDIRNTVEAMRRMLDDGMLRIIALGAVPASKIRTLLSGEGKWIHRDFDVFHHDPSEYRKKLQAMARAGEDVISPLLPDIEKDLQLPDADVLQTIADMLGTKGGKKDWRKESMEKLRKVTGEPTPKRGATPKTNKAVRDAAEEYLRDMAAKWGIGRNTEMDGKDGIIARLIELSKNGDIRAAASRYANSLLDPKAGYNDDAPYIPSVMGIDDSSLDKRRKKVPEWMQTLWGRFQDPVAMFLTSVDNHANVIAKFTALAEYKARGMANGTVLENKEGMTDYNMFPKGFVLLQKENDPLYYGPLNGMWVKQKDMDYLGVTASQRMAEKMLSQGIGPTFFRPYSLLMQPVKMMQIAADHTSFIINAVSAVFMMSRANPFTTIPRGLKAARYTALGGTRFGKALNDSAFNSDVNAMIRQGLLVNNALAGEARRKLRELIMEPGERFLPTPVKLMNKLKRAGGKLSDSLSRALSFFDEAGKVMMVYARMKDLEAIYPDKSRDEIREIAIEHSMQTMPVASREAPIARMAGNSGVVNVYATFYAAMVRNTYNHLKLADEYSKMEGPAAKRYAFAEMALLSLKALGMYILTKTGIAVFGYMYSGSDDDDEDEREKAAKAQQEHYDELRAMHPEYQQGDVLYTRESEPDVFHFLSAQRYDPLPFGALAAASARGDENEKMNLLVSYLFSDSPILEPLSNVIGYGVQTAAGEITEPDSFSLSAKERFMKGAEELLKAGVPGAWKRFEKQYKSDDEATPFEMFANNVGFTHGVLDLRKETGNAAAGYLAIINSLKRDAGKRVSTEDGVFFDAKADFVGDVTARAEAWRIARRKISAMQKYGKSDEWIEEAIDANPYTSSMSKDEVESLLDGVFRVPDYQEWLDRQYEIDIADPKNARRLDEVEEQYARYGKELQQFEEGLADLLKGMEVEYY